VSYFEVAAMWWWPPGQRSMAHRRRYQNGEARRAAILTVPVGTVLPPTVGRSDDGGDGKMPTASGS
jgi:hypothetical protein